MRKMDVKPGIIGRFKWDEFNDDGFGDSSGNTWQIASKLDGNQFLIIQPGFSDYNWDCLFLNGEKLTVTYNEIEPLLRIRNVKEKEFKGWLSDDTIWYTELDENLVEDAVEHDRRLCIATGLKCEVVRDGIYGERPYIQTDIPM